MATALPLEITDFLNPKTGSVSKRVSGTLNGERIRRNFADEVAAQAFLNSKIAHARQRRPAPVITSLPEIVVRQAEAAVLRLPPGADLAQAVEFFAAHHRALQALAIADAIEAFGEWLTTQRKNESGTVDQRKIVLTDFARDAEVTRSDRITAENAAAWIYSRDVQPRTQRDRFDLLNWFCLFLVKKRHAAFNPCAELDRPVVKVKVPRVFTFDEAWRLLHCALTDAEGPQMLPFFALCLLSGTRPQEAPRLRGWEDIYLEPEHRIIELNRAKGGLRRRNITIGDALWRILSWCKAEKLAPNYFSKRKFDRIRRRAGLFAKWEKDICRHTYASAHYVVHKDIKQLEADMGNSERVLFQNYIRPVPLVDGVKLQGLFLDFTAPREKSAMGAGPKPRKLFKRATPA